MAHTLSTSEATCEAFFNQTHFIYGRELLPFCLRHWILLSALKSPLIAGGSVTLADMRLAVVACSTVNDKEFMEACQFSSDYWSVWKRFTSHCATEKAFAAFNRYVEDYMPVFPFWNTDKSNDENKLDGFVVLAARLLSSCTPDYIENMPLGKLVVWAMAKNESEGFPNKNLMTDHEVSIAKYMDTLAAQEAA